MWPRYPRRCSQTCLGGWPSGRGNGVTQTFRARRRRRRPPPPPALRPSVEAVARRTIHYLILISSHGKTQDEAGWHTSVRMRARTCVCVCASVMSQYDNFTPVIIITKMKVIAIISPLLKCAQNVKKKKRAILHTGIIVILNYTNKRKNNFSFKKNNKYCLD